VASRPHPVVFLVDVDNTLLDNDRIRLDIQTHVAERLGAETGDRYWSIQERLFVELGYRDYLGAVQQAWCEPPVDMRLLALSSYLVDYPFADCLYPDALAVLARFRGWGTTVALTDGEAVFQARKLDRAGITGALGGEVLVYVHKEQELDDVERRYPAERYVVVDDKPAILAAVKEAWGERVTTVLPRQGQFANDVDERARHRAPDVTVERIGDLLGVDLEVLLDRRG
jgi:FMN phosphatase YigB (HAD superfamily)